MQHRRRPQGRALHLLAWLVCCMGVCLGLQPDARFQQQQLAARVHSGVEQAPTNHIAASKFSDGPCSISAQLALNKLLSPAATACSAVTSAQALCTPACKGNLAIAATLSEPLAACLSVLRTGAFRHSIGGTGSGHAAAVTISHISKDVLAFVARADSVREGKYSMHCILGGLR